MVVEAPEAVLPVEPGQRGKEREEEEEEEVRRRAAAGGGGAPPFQACKGGRVGEGREGRLLTG